MVKYEEISYIECIYQILNDQERELLISLLADTNLLTEGKIGYMNIISINSILHGNPAPPNFFIQQIVMLLKTEKNNQFLEIKIEPRIMTLTLKLIEGGELTCVLQNKILNLRENGEQYFYEKNTVLSGLLFKLKNDPVNTSYPTIMESPGRGYQGPKTFFFRKYVIKEYLFKVEYSESLVCFHSKDTKNIPVEKLIKNIVPAISSNSTHENLLNLHSWQILRIVENEKGKTQESDGFRRVKYRIHTDWPKKDEKEDKVFDKYFEVKSERLYLSYKDILYLLKETNKNYIQDRFKTVYKGNYVEIDVYNHR